MKRVNDIARALLISPEALLVAIALLLLNFWPDLFSNIGKRLETAGRVTDLVYALPIGLFLLSLKQQSFLLFPGEKEQELLLGWPDYAMIKDRFLITLFIIGCCALVGIAIWAFDADLSVPYVTALVFCSSSVSVVSWACLQIGAIDIREEVGKHLGER